MIGNGSPHFAKTEFGTNIPPVITSDRKETVSSQLQVQYIIEKQTIQMPAVVPLESNPEVFSELAYTLGLSPVLGFHDVYSLTDPELLAFLPQPLLAVVLLFPISAGYEADRKVLPGPQLVNDNKINWFKQTIKNGCGLYALLHALANLSSDFIVEDLILNKLLLTRLTSDLTQNEISSLVEQLTQAIQLDANFGLKGQTDAPEADNEVLFHFVTYLKGADGHVYELDGRRDGPVDLGHSEEGSGLLSDSKVSDRVNFYINHTDDSEKDKFAVMAIAPTL